MTQEHLDEIDHANPICTVQGGVLAALADTAMGWAFMTTLGEGEISSPTPSARA